MSFELVATLVGIGVSAVFSILGKLLWSKYEQMYEDIEQAIERVNRAEVEVSDLKKDVEYLRRDLGRYEDTTDKIFKILDHIQEQLSEIKQTLAANQIK
jgi:archaellum component FlaC